MEIKKEVFLNFFDTFAVFAKPRGLKAQRKWWICTKSKEVYTIYRARACDYYYINFEVCLFCEMFRSEQFRHSVQHRAEPTHLHVLCSVPASSSLF